MPSLFDEYRVLLELLKELVYQEMILRGKRHTMTLGELHSLLNDAVAQVDEAEAKAS